MEKSGKILITGPGESLIERTGEILFSSKSMENNIVIFPGKRPAHFLRKYLADKTGSACLSPKIFSMDLFMDFAASELGFNAPAVSRLDTAYVLYRRLKPGFCRLINVSEKEITLDSFLAWAFKLIGDFEELKIELKTPKDLDGYDLALPENLRSASFGKKIGCFSELYADFYSILEKESLFTRSMKYVKVSEHMEKLDSAKYGNIVFAGFFALTNAERIILKHLFHSGAFVVLQSGPGLEEQFDFLRPLPEQRASGSSSAGGFVPLPQPLPGPAAPPELYFYKAADAHGEIFKLAQLMQDISHKSSRRWRDKQAVSSDVIVLPEAQTLFPLIEHVLQNADEFNISMGYPLVSTPLHSLIDALADLLDKRSQAGYFIPNYLNFVFHPYVKNTYFRVENSTSAEPGRVIFQTIETKLASNINRYAHLEDIESDKEILNEASAKLAHYGWTDITGRTAGEHIKSVHNALIKPFEKIENVGDFSQKLLDFVSYISGNSAASLHPYWAPFAGKTMECLMELKSSVMSHERFNDPSGYFKFFRNLVKEAAYPFPGTPLKGLQVLGFLETRGLKFDRVYFLDANAGVLPASRKEDTLLSHFVRRSLGLATYKTRELIARYYFSVLLYGAREVHVFYKENAYKERSPFVEKLIWDMERVGKKPSETDIYFRIKFFQDEPKAIKKDKTIIEALKDSEFSPSAVDSYLSCGLQFYCRYVLRLSEKDEVSGEIEKRDIGSIVHEILEKFFESKKGGALEITSEDSRAILAVAKKVFDSRMKNHDTGYEYLIKRQVEKRLLDVLEYHRTNLSGIRILSCETVLRAEIKTSFGNAKLKGRADRIDRRSGAIHILDYKTGSSAGIPDWRKFDLDSRKDWPKTLKSVQMPFYVLAYTLENEQVKPADIDASLMLLGKEEIQERNLFFPARGLVRRSLGEGGKPADKSGIFSRYKKAVSILIEEILNPGLSFEPASDETVCEGCLFKTMCGRQWINSKG